MRKKSNTSFPSDDEKFTSDTKSTVGLADPGTTGEDAVDEAIGETGAGNTESESDNDDPEATKRYWEAKRRKEGDKRLVSCAVICLR